MKLLAFELATEACSVALWNDGEVAERFELAPRRHAELALPWADALLSEAGIGRSQLDAIAVGRGPGAFTGVRLAIAVGQGIALALDRPLVPVSTLAVLAMRATGPRVLAAIDARMGEVYLGAFEREGDHVRPLSDEVLGAPATVVVPEGEWHGVGTGFAAGEGALVQRLRGHSTSQLVHVDDTQLPHAADLARLAAVAFEQGGAVAADAVEPAYLRNNVALTLAEQRALRK
ncbi:MAG: tRNA (adenosine(37)-N6)-threonylcarbamoyltransferase complex dimerization subunit type 1 TsaB [Lysobacterales bacterium RIFOXYD1_FULL_69_11]|nr:MAG: tRNA (adenosine(37)-N6)-threonylcarbamoyltransferase complex dimerization subunit type 1 TsaB [Xanthomonadales bacterium RIFOXYA1_FULL_69_10]OHE86440.1 MAG: tRNA (adenosine(37)-N6)-threonylcarbamoyltransferase complex dimerization subunit type 1 TsaB [Xanthomonadales bacterium RIFOXYD1_FULL_69_11]